MLLESRTRSLNPVASSRMVAKALLGNFRHGKATEVDQLSVENVLRLLKNLESKTNRVYRPIGMVGRGPAVNLNEMLGAAGGERALREHFEEIRNEMDPSVNISAFIARLQLAFGSLHARHANPSEIEYVQRFLNLLASSHTTG